MAALPAFELPTVARDDDGFGPPRKGLGVSLIRSVVMLTTLGPMRWTTSTAAVRRRKGSAASAGENEMRLSPRVKLADHARIRAVGRRGAVTGVQGRACIVFSGRLGCRESARSGVSPV